MNNKIRYLESKLKKQMNALENLKTKLPSKSPLIPKIGRILENADDLREEAMLEEWKEFMLDASKNIESIREAIKGAKAQDARQMWIDADSRIMRLLPEEDKKYWESIEPEEREVILDAMEQSAEIDKPFGYPEGEKLVDLLGVNRKMNKMRLSDSRAVDGNGGQIDPFNIVKRSKNGKEIRSSPLPPIAGDENYFYKKKSRFGFIKNIFNPRKKAIDKVKEEGDEVNEIDKNYIKSELSHEIRYLRDDISPVASYGSLKQKEPENISKREIILKKKKAKIPKEEAFGYFKNWYDKTWSKRGIDEHSKIPEETKNYFKKMTELHEKLEYIGFSKKEAAQIIQSFNPSNIDEIEKITEDKNYFNEFIKFAESEPDKRDTASKYFAIKFMGKQNLLLDDMTKELIKKSNNEINRADELINDINKRLGKM